MNHVVVGSEQNAEHPLFAKLLKIASERLTSGQRREGYPGALLPVSRTTILNRCIRV
jgi:hypothetical protein